MHVGTNVEIKIVDFSRSQRQALGDILAIQSRKLKCSYLAAILMISMFGARIKEWLPFR